MPGPWAHQAGPGSASFKNRVRGRQARFVPHVQLEHRPAAGSVARLDRAAVRLRYLPDDRQAEPCRREASGGSSAVEAVKHVRKVRRRDARPVVANADRYQVPTNEPEAN